MYVWFFGVGLYFSVVKIFWVWGVVCVVVVIILFELFFMKDCGVFC